ncbi:hypothetical protein [Nocardia huaxiensis]|uniref:hypothetical protein n=1 Tax=Nocardia huaxiensis TaxID=2755382 RepID=UPI001E4E6ABD|nr:hypothetical protein [Nocardia huaxiensis]UFS93770.1 hypothetical protein LPY97_23580 [Nocardia huaxiensis]
MSTHYSAGTGIGSVGYFRDMFDDPGLSEDPELAQARVFLRELERHMAGLTRRLQTALTSEARQSIDTELTTVRRYVDRIHRRFPGITARAV